MCVFMFHCYCPECLCRIFLYPPCLCVPPPPPPLPPSPPHSPPPPLFFLTLLLLVPRPPPQQCGSYGFPVVNLLQAIAQMQRRSRRGHVIRWKEGNASVSCPGLRRKKGGGRGEGREGENFLLCPLFVYTCPCSKLMFQFLWPLTWRRNSSYSLASVWPQQQRPSLVWRCEGCSSRRYNVTVSYSAFL